MRSPCIMVTGLMIGATAHDKHSVSLSVSLSLSLSVSLTHSATVRAHAQCPRHTRKVSARSVPWWSGGATSKPFQSNALSPKRACAQGATRCRWARM